MWESMQQSSLIVTDELLYWLDDIFRTWDITHTTEQTDLRQCWGRPSSEEEFPMAMYHPYGTVDPIHTCKRRVFVDKGRNKKRGIRTSYSDLRNAVWHQSAMGMGQCNLMWRVNKHFWLRQHIINPGGGYHVKMGVWIKRTKIHHGHGWWGVWHVCGLPRTPTHPHPPPHGHNKTEIWV
jgi:hypothetical protein